jgi:hypothetical protein
MHSRPGAGCRDANAAMIYMILARAPTLCYGYLPGLYKGTVQMDENSLSLPGRWSCSPPLGQQPKAYQMKAKNTKNTTPSTNHNPHSPGPSPPSLPHLARDVANQAPHCLRCRRPQPIHGDTSRAPPPASRLQGNGRQPCAAGAAK